MLTNVNDEEDGGSYASSATQPPPEGTIVKKIMSSVAFAIAAASLPTLAADIAAREKVVVTGTTVVELKDGGKITIDADGKTYHVDSAGKRVRMKDGVVMEGKDGTKYLHKNDVIWKQITETGTLAPNR